MGQPGGVTIWWGNIMVGQQPGWVTSWWGNSLIGIVWWGNNLVGKHYCRLIF